MSSAGLVYVFYGERIINEVLQKEIGETLSKSNLELCFHHIYRNFVQEIDAIDNGVSICPDGSQAMYHINTHLSERVSNLNQNWLETEKENVDARFQKAMKLVGEEFIQKVTRTATVWLKARELVRESILEALKKNPAPETIVLKQCCPWKVHLSELEKEYNLIGIPKMVVYPDSSTNKFWRVCGVPISPESFKGRKFLPQPWRGKNDKELSKLAGIENLEFVHHSGFIGGAKTFDAAIEMANKSNNWQN